MPTSNSNSVPGSGTTAAPLVGDTAISLGDESNTTAPPSSVGSKRKVLPAPTTRLVPVGMALESSAHNVPSSTCVPPLKLSVPPRIKNPGPQLEQPAGPGQRPREVDRVALGIDARIAAAAAKCQRRALGKSRRWPPACRRQGSSCRDPGSRSPARSGRRRSNCRRRTSRGQAHSHDVRPARLRERSGTFITDELGSRREDG